MPDRKTSAKISLGICIASSAALLALAVTFPRFYEWFYFLSRSLSEESDGIIKTVTVAFYVSAPFAAAALYMLIRLLLNIIRDEVFVGINVTYLRLISYCCFGVVLVNAVCAFFYAPLFITVLVFVIVGTLLRVVKNVMQSAVALREENDLTI